MKLVDRLAAHIERGIADAHDWHYLSVPGVTFAATSAINLLARLFPQISTSLALPFLVYLVAAFWWGNLWSALLGAAVLSAYTLIESGFDAWRGGQLIAASVVGAFLVQAAKESLIHQIKAAERARRTLNLIDAADKSLARLKSMHKRVSDFVQGYAVLSEAARFEFMVNHRGELANILQSYDGFHRLWLERREVQAGEEIKGGQQ